MITCIERFDFVTPLWAVFVFFFNHLTPIKRTEQQKQNKNVLLECHCDLRPCKIQTHETCYIQTGHSNYTVFIPTGFPSVQCERYLRETNPTSYREKCVQVALLDNTKFGTNMVV